MIPVRWVS